MLQRIERTLAATVQPVATDEGAAATDGADGGGGGGASGPGITVTGSIRTRSDVVRVLENVCDYYRQCEPGSPVPLLLRRAQKIATMNFIEGVQELNLATVEQLRPSMGSAVDTPPG